MDGNMSPADFSALMGNGAGFGGNNSWWIILLFLFIMGNGWNRGGDYGQYATAASQQEILFGQQFNRLESKADNIINGISSATYALNNDINAVGSKVDAVKYEGAINTAAINANIDAKFAALEKGQLQQTITQQAARIGQLELQSQLCGVVRYPTQMVYANAGSPFCNYNGSCGNI